jgi:type II secretory pathway pseudopilin PulG
MRVRSKMAFSLLEIMIIVGIIGLMVGLAIPAFVKARKISQAQRVLNDVRQLDTAISQWALENGKRDGDSITGNEIALSSYLKAPWPTGDVLGHPYSLGTVGTNQVTVSPLTKTALAGGNIDWGPF